MNHFHKSHAKWKVFIDREGIQGICKNRKIDRKDTIINQTLFSQ